MNLSHFLKEHTGNTKEKGLSLGAREGSSSGIGSTGSARPLRAAELGVGRRGGQGLSLLLLTLDLGTPASSRKVLIALDGRSSWLQTERRKA